MIPGQPRRRHRRLRASWLLGTSTTDTSARAPRDGFFQHLFDRGRQASWPPRVGAGRRGNGRRAVWRLPRGGAPRWHRCCRGLTRYAGRAVPPWRRILLATRTGTPAKSRTKVRDQCPERGNADGRPGAGSHHAKAPVVEDPPSRRTEAEHDMVVIVQLCDLDSRRSAFSHGDSSASTFDPERRPTPQAGLLTCRPRTSRGRCLRAGRASSRSGPRVGAEAAGNARAGRDGGLEPSSIRANMTGGSSRRTISTSGCSGTALPFRQRNPAKQGRVSLGALD